MKRDGGEKGKEGKNLTSITGHLTLIYLALLQGNERVLRCLGEGTLQCPSTHSPRDAPRLPTTPHNTHLIFSAEENAAIRKKSFEIQNIMVKERM